MSDVSLLPALCPASDPFHVHAEHLPISSPPSSPLPYSNVVVESTGDRLQNRLSLHQRSLQVAHVNAQTLLPHFIELSAIFSQVQLHLIMLELSLLLTTEDVPSSDLLELLPSKKLTLKLLLVHKVANSSSVLRSWDINTVYTTSRGFTEHDLKVKITLSLRTDDQPQDAWFPEWDPERPTTHLVKGQMNVAWGAVDDSRCPRDSSGLRVTVRAELSDEQSVLGDNKSYRACRVDSSGKEGLLLTEACSWVAREMATMRKYIANFRYTKLPEVLLSAGDYLVSLLEVLYPGVTPDSSEYGVMVTAEFPMSRPEVKLTVNKRHTTVSARQPWLLNTLYSPGLALATRYRIIKMAMHDTSPYSTHMQQNTLCGHYAILHGESRKGAIPTEQPQALVTIVPTFAGRGYHVISTTSPAAAYL
ncbi:unnamed protein product, partial [Timema podura]|nr:unnamed protein product [Timema podura]